MKAGDQRRQHSQKPRRSALQLAKQKLTHDHKPLRWRETDRGDAARTMRAAPLLTGHTTFSVTSMLPRVALEYGQS